MTSGYLPPAFSLTRSSAGSYNDVDGVLPVFAKVGFYVWFNRNARDAHHPGDRADHLWPPQVTGAGPFARQEPRRIQASVERAQEHARGRNPPRRTAYDAGSRESERSRGGEIDGRTRAADGSRRTSRSPRQRVAALRHGVGSL